MPVTRCIVALAASSATSRVPAPLGRNTTSGGAVACLGYALDKFRSFWATAGVPLSGLYTILNLPAPAAHNEDVRSEHL